MWEEREWDTCVLRKGKLYFHGEAFLDWLISLVVIWPVEWRLSFSSRLCRHHDGCCWKHDGWCFCPDAILEARLGADNQVHLLARGSDTAVAASWQAEAHVLQEKRHFWTLLKVTLVLTTLPWMWTEFPPRQTARWCYPCYRRPTGVWTRGVTHVNGSGGGTVTFLHTACASLLAEGAVMPLGTTCLLSLEQKLEGKADWLSKTRTQFQLLCQSEVAAC